MKYVFAFIMVFVMLFGCGDKVEDKNKFTEEELVDTIYSMTDEYGLARPVVEFVDEIAKPNEDPDNDILAMTYCAQFTLSDVIVCNKIQIRECVLEDARGKEVAVHEAVHFIVETITQRNVSHGVEWQELMVYYGYSPTATYPINSFKQCE